MNCRAARKRIGLWVGNDLSQSAIESLEQHIENCPKCQERAEVLLSSSDVLLAFNTETVRSPSDSVWDDVRQQIEADPRRERLRSHQLTGGLLLAAAMLLLAVLPDLLANTGSRVSRRRLGTGHGPSARVLTVLPGPDVAGTGDAGHTLAPRCRSQCCLRVLSPDRSCRSIDVPTDHRPTSCTPGGVTDNQRSILRVC